MQKNIRPNPTSIHNKTPRKLEVKGNFLNLIKNHKIINANSTLNGWSLNAFPPKIKTQVKVSIFPKRIYIVPEVLAISIMQEHKTKQNCTDWKGRTKSILICRLQDSLHRKSQGVYYKLLSKFSKITEYRMNIQISIILPYISKKKPWK